MRPAFRLPANSNPAILIIGARARFLIVIAVRGAITSGAVTIAIALTLAITPLFSPLILSSVLPSLSSFAVPSFITSAVSSTLVVLGIPVTRLAFLLLSLSPVRLLAFLPRAVTFFFLRALLASCALSTCFFLRSVLLFLRLLGYFGFFSFFCCFRDGPLEKLWGGRGIFELQEFFFAIRFFA